MVQVNRAAARLILRMMPVAVFLALLAPISLVAQTFRGGIAGTVTDASGAIVAGAAIKMVSPDTNYTREGVTSSSGEFTFQDLPLGKYELPSRSRVLSRYTYPA